MKRINNVVLGSLLGCLVLALVGITYVLNRPGDDQTMINSRIRAQSVTYTDELNLLAQNQVSPTVPLENSLDASASPTLSPTLEASASATPAITITPTLTDTPTPTASASPTIIETLPRTGWTQNVSIMFVAASVLMFVSFIF